jgi:hypothetical protein
MLEARMGWKAKLFLSSARYWFIGVGVKGNKIIAKYKFSSKSSIWHECVNSQRSHLSLGCFFRGEGWIEVWLRLNGSWSLCRMSKKLVEAERRLKQADRRFEGNWAEVWRKLSRGLKEAEWRVNGSWAEACTLLAERKNTDNSWSFEEFERKLVLETPCNSPSKVPLHSLQL